MAVLALAGFTQPSIELGYAIKFMRVFLLIGAAIFGVWGAFCRLAVNHVGAGDNEKIVGSSYLYPLIPFHWDTLRQFDLQDKNSMNM
jgi:stage V sporulation protein AF